MRILSNEYAKSFNDHDKLDNSDLKSNKIRAVNAIWEEDENTASLSFYIDGETTEEELEDFSIACAEIIAHCSNGLLKEDL